MSITPGADIPLLGDNGRPVNNPLVVLNSHLGQISNALQEMAVLLGGSVPHVYTQQVVNDPGHGAVWGTFCLGCSHSAREYVYPCQEEEKEVIKPPAFFTIGDVFTPDEHGRLLKYQAPSS